MSRTLSTFELFQLNSERYRSLVVLGILAMVMILGTYRWFDPIPGQEMVGPIVFVLAMCFLLFCVFYLRRVRQHLRNKLPLPNSLVIFATTVESVFPAVAMVTIIFLTPIDPLYVLVSPGYSVMYLIMAASLLRMRLHLTLLTGSILLLSYTSIVTWALYIDTPSALPYGEMFYINHVVSLAMGVALCVFLTLELDKYVRAAIREAEVSKENDRMTHEMSLAGEIQQQLLPSPLPAIPGYRLAALCKPAAHTGGDYYDCIELPNNKMAISIADVTGHGIGPAIIASSCRACFRAMLHDRNNVEIDIAAVLQNINKLLYGDMTSGRFVTLALMVLDMRSHELTFLSAGHAPSLFYHANPAEVRMIPSQGHPIGVTETLDLEEPVTFRFEPGDFIVLFSDGIYETTDENNEPFGLDRLCGHMKSNCHITADELVTSLHSIVCEHTANPAQADDMTAIVLQREYVEADKSSR